MKQWLSNDIKNLRAKCNLSQRALAELLGVSEQYIYYIERGSRKPSKMFNILLDCITEHKLKRKENDL